MKVQLAGSIFSRRKQIGPSGCGKSTIIRLLAGFERPSEGTMTLDGTPVTAPVRDRLVLFQETALSPWMTT